MELNTQKRWLRITSEITVNASAEWGVFLWLKYKDTPYLICIFYFAINSKQFKAKHNKSK